jgi:hypothetical protein
MALALYDGRGRLVQTVFEGYLASGDFQMDLPRIRTIPSGFYTLALYRKENAAKKLAASCTAVLFGK